MKKEKLNSQRNLFWIFILVSLFFFMATIVQFYLYLNRSMDELNSSMNAVIQGLEDRLDTIDKLYLVIEEDLDLELSKILTQIDEEYQQEGLASIDLKSFSNYSDYIDLYVINSDNVIIDTTLESDLGLDFGTSSKFADFLEQVRSERGYHSDRINLSTVTEDLKKFVYFGSYDGKFIFEASYNMNAFRDLLGKDSITELISNSASESNHILSVRVFNSRGESYNDNFVLTESDHKMRYSAYRDVYDNGSSRSESESIDIFYKNYFHYFPYIPARKYSDFPTFAVEVTYTDRYIKKDLLSKFAFQIFLIVVFTSLVFYQFISYKKRFLTPLKSIYDGIKMVDTNQFRTIETIKTNNEMKIIGDAFNLMIMNLQESFTTIRAHNESLENIVEERTRHLQDANDELSLALTELEKVHEALIDKERVEAINNVIMEISHRLNTPLGNAIGYLSFAQQLVGEKDIISSERSDVSDSMKLALKNLKVAARIMTTFKDVSDLNKLGEVKTFSLKTFVDSTFQQYKQDDLLSDTKLIKVTCSGSDLIKTNYQLLEKVFDYLFQFSRECDIHCDKLIEVTLDEDSAHYIISYYDEFPFSHESEFDLSGSLNLLTSHNALHSFELFLLKNIIALGLKGQMKLLHIDGTDEDYICITIPKI